MEVAGFRRWQHHRNGYIASTDTGIRKGSGRSRRSLPDREPPYETLGDEVCNFIETRFMRRDSFRRYQPELTAQAEIKTQAHK